MTSPPSEAIVKLLKAIAEAAKVPLPAKPQLAGDVASAGGVISARACVVCGRTDRPGEQRKKGFKCFDCVGIPSQNRFEVQIEEMNFLERTTTESGEKMINGLIFESALGKGSYGKVVLARHHKSDQKYAVKILNKANMARRHAMDKVYAEIGLMKKLNHPNIIKIYTVIDDPDADTMYLVMEYLEGGQICHLDPGGEATSGKLTLSRLKRYCFGIAQGIEYLHRMGIIHRDIKPENILLDKHDNVKLADFGVSSNCEPGADIMSNTEGSPAFFPPEEFRSIPVQGRAQDMWAFGVTVYSMAFGVLPFRATTMDELAELVVNTEPKYPSDADPRLLDMLKQMLRKNQEQRPQVQDILNHPFLADVHCVKGVPVDAYRTTVDFVPTVADAQKSRMGCCVVSSEHPSHMAKGTKALVDFCVEEGPELQLLKGGDYSVTLHSVKNDPRKKKWGR